MASGPSEPAAVVAVARRLARTATDDPGFERLSGGVTHDVFLTSIGERRVVIKVYRRPERGEEDREWEALRVMAPTGLAPEPISFHPDRLQPVIVMAYVPGGAINGGSIGDSHADAIARAHLTVHGRALPTGRRAMGHPAVILERTRSLFRSWIPALPDTGDELVATARRHADLWLAAPSRNRLADLPATTFCRGDANLTNYLWRADALWLIDWEDSGSGDPAFELADMAEHAGTRAVREAVWSRIADAYAFDASGWQRYRDGRRLMACFWLAILERRSQAGLPVLQVSVEAQARRLIESLD